MELEHQQLDLRYSQLRLRSPRQEKRLVASIAEVGQLVPISVVRADADPARLIVIDGFKRVRALRRLKTDVVRAFAWELSELDALLLHRSLQSAQGESALEQAWLLRELQVRFDLSQQDLARQFQRSKSWISRRLALIGDLPPEVQDLVRLGRLTPHAATKYLVPVARANRDDCVRLAAVAAEQQLSTRDLGLLYAGWRDGSAVSRERLLEDPQLYLRSRQALIEASENPPGPREGLLKDVEILGAVARRALGRLKDFELGSLAALDHDVLGAGLELVAGHVRQLMEALRTTQGEATHARPEHPNRDPRVA
ncbi:MAG: hypothetical protein CMF76_00060 [Maricaulis sp.]|nr:hypothetical protein [Maricaulis sp.]